MPIEIKVTQRKHNMTLFSSHGQVILSNGVVDVIVLPEQISRLIGKEAITELRDLAGNVINWTDNTIRTLEFIKQWRPIKETCVTHSDCKIIFLPKGEKSVFIEIYSSIMCAQPIWALPDKPLLVFYGKNFMYLPIDTIIGLKLLDSDMEIAQLIPED